LKRHLPIGEKVQVPRDNVFPLLDPTHRHIAFASNWKTISSTQESAANTVTLEVCHGSPKPYTYQIDDVITEIKVIAFADGYADAAFTWSISGTPLPASTGKKPGVATVAVTITDTKPDSNESPVPGEISIEYFVDDTHWNKSTLVLRNAVFPGNATLDITAQAKEVLVNDQSTAHTETLALLMRAYDMGNDYWLDSYKCRAKGIWEMSRAVASLIDSVTVLKNTPDPAPEQMIAIAAIAKRYTEALQATTNNVIGLQGGVATLARQIRQSFITSTTSELPGIAGGSPVLVRTDLGARLPSGRGERSTW
jgi:hypothetical protein